MNLNMDLNETGLKMFFKEYELEALKTLWHSDKGLLSREVWEQVNLKESISRASIINFLNDLAEMSILYATEETGKGGYRSRYMPVYNEPQLKQYLAKAVNEKLNELTK